MKNQISEERRAYLKKKRNHLMMVRGTQIFLVLFILCLWEVLANFEIIDSFITSKPSKVFETFLKMMSEGLLYHIGITCLETMLGFLLGTIIGVGVASLLWWSTFFSEVLSPFFVVLNSLPKVALGPIIIIWVGAGMPAIITMALAISVVVTILDMLNGFMATDRNKMKMAETFGASRFQVFTKIVFPSNVSTLLNVLKVSIGLSMVGVITGEFLVSKGGLGYLIVYGGQVFKLDLVMTSVIILAIVATFMYLAVCLLERLISLKGRWQ